MGKGPVALRRLGEVRAAAGRASSPACGTATAERRTIGPKVPDGRRNAVREPVVSHATGLRPVPRVAVLGTAGHHRAAPGHDAYGQLAQVVGRRALRERHAHHVAGER